MRHANKGRKFGRKRDQRKAFIKSLVVNLLMKGKIKTTEARAKELRHLAERLITKTKKGNLAGIRFAKRFLPDAALNKLIKDIAPKFADRQGGYVRITKLGPRKGDGASAVFIEFV